eukprot:3504788-Amphidinium_carterae.1
MSNAEVAAQGELNEVHAAYAASKTENEQMESKIAELMKAGRDVTDHRDNLLGEFRSERAKQQAETIRQTEL